VYLRRAAPTQSLLDYALFVTFFPHLVAGPIMRPTELIPQFAEPRQASGQQLRFGLALMTLGLFNKIVLADSLLSGAVDRVYDGDKIPGALDAWAGTLAFSGEVFCDFAGYSTTAIGAALCLGFFLPDNFRFPYAAVGFSEFWRRWHITLSSWLRDYVYIPLGGNKYGPTRTYFALFLTMLLAGLWHGANWTYVAFGGLHGFYLAAERALRRYFGNYRPGPIVFALLGLLTYLLFVVSLALFRARSFGKAWLLLRGMCGQNSATAPILSTFSLICVGVIVGCIVLTHWAMRSRTLESVVAHTPSAAIGVLWALMAFAIVIVQGGGSAFIYFQF
jgi:alginate O-acetyltransferase complex protein AlgI